MVMFYAGRFDPFHNSHLNAALNASRYFDSDILILVAKENAKTDLYLREAVVKASIQDHSRLRVEPEGKLNLENYLEELSNPDILWGIDKLFTVGVRPIGKRIMRDCNIVTTDRPGYNFLGLPKMYSPEEKNSAHPSGLNGLDYQAWINVSGKRLFYCKFPTDTLCGTTIRKELAKGNDITNYMANPEAARIYTCRIY
jgi:nicotinic acid mononucleotide adenylyltransferase